MIVMLIFGASGDLTKRLLVPALYNLACDGLLSDKFAVLGTAFDSMSTESFRARMNEDINKVLLMPDVMEKLEVSGAEDGGGSPEKFAQFMRSEQGKWAKVIKDANVKADT